MFLEIFWKEIQFSELDNFFVFSNTKFINLNKFQLIVHKLRFGRILEFFFIVFGTILKKPTKEIF